MTKLKVLLITSCALCLVTVLLTLNGAVTKSQTSSNKQTGKWVVSGLPDQQQNLDSTVPIIVVRVLSGPSEADSVGQRQLLLKEVIVENRSAKVVSSVILKWRISPLNNRSITLAKGEFKPYVFKSLHKTLQAGKRQTLKLEHPKLTQLIEQIPNVESMSNEFGFSIGLAEVVFEDGSKWKEELTDVTKKSDEPATR